MCATSAKQDLKIKIEQRYRVRLILDNLPITTYDLERGPESVRPGFDLGFWADDRHFVNNHLMFKVLVYKTNGQYTRARKRFEEMEAASVVEVPPSAPTSSRVSILGSKRPPVCASALAGPGALKPGGWDGEKAACCSANGRREGPCLAPMAPPPLSHRATSMLHPSFLCLLPQGGARKLQSAEVSDGVSAPSVDGRQLKALWSKKYPPPPPPVARGKETPM